MTTQQEATLVARTLEGCLEQNRRKIHCTKVTVQGLYVTCHCLTVQGRILESLTVALSNL